MKMGLPARKMDRVYTYRDYRSWPEDERWELIHGEAWNMSPAPSVNHQRLLVLLTRIIGNTLEGTGCELLVAPADVFLPSSPDQEEDDIDTVVQPDLLVVCDPAKINQKGVRGAPDWAIEILSPYTTRKDVSVKLALYEEQGVREYWIVDPGNRCVHVYLRNDEGRYGEPVLYEEPAEIASATCVGLVIGLRELFSVVRT
jgi:Uma2 family endonuclease